MKINHPKGAKSLSLAEKCRIIELHGSPEYLFELNNSVLVPIQTEKEISRVYEEAFNKATRKAKYGVLKRYFGLAPHLAFRRYSWSWLIWNKSSISKKSDKESLKILNAIANGIKSGRFHESVTKQTQLEAAKIFVADKMRNKDLQSLAKEWRELIRMRNQRQFVHSDDTSYQKTHLDSILAFFVHQNPYRIGLKELKEIENRLAKGLRPTVEYVASILFNIPIRYLQSHKRFPPTTAKS